MRNSKDRTVSLILSRLLNRMGSLSTERLILTTKSLYINFLQNKYSPNKQQLHDFIKESEPQIDRYMKVKLYGTNKLLEYQRSVKATAKP